MVPRTRPGLGQAVGLHGQGDPEVGHLRAALGVDQDVLRLHVAVDHVGEVRGLEPAADLDRVGGRLVERQPAVAVDPLLERLAVDVLEDDVGVAVLVVAGVDDRDHVGVGDARDRARLAAEALELVGLIRHLAVEHLRRHISLQRLVEREVDGRHSARAELGLQAVSAGQDLADHAGPASCSRFGAHLSSRISG